MTIDEHGLRRRLEETAAKASAPRFTTEDVVRQVRRRRTRFIAMAVGAVVAAGAVAVAVPVALSGKSQPMVSHAPPVPPELTYAVTVNGRTEMFPAGSSTAPRFAVTPGENLTIVVDAYVPADTTMSAVWLGITDGVLSPRPDGPANMNPILAARSGAPLSPGVHRFTLRWAVPASLRPGTSRQLAAEWAWSRSSPSRSPGESEAFIAELGIQAAPGA